LIKNVIPENCLGTDLLMLKEKNVKEIREKVKPFLLKKPRENNQKIIYIEECDKINKDAELLLKDGLMEKYQDKCVFISCTNYINKIDRALLTRYTFKIELNNNRNIDKIIERCKFILDSEGAEYEEIGIKKFVEENYHRGLRELINLLQNDYIRNNGKMTFNTKLCDINLEHKIISNIVEIIKKIFSIKDPKQKQFCYSMPMQSVIANEWNECISTLHNNYDINYEQIMLELYNNIQFLPIKVIISKYLESIEIKKYPHLHVLAMISEIIKCCCEV
jgi:hypothetical protein